MATVMGQVSIPANTATALHTADQGAPCSVTVFNDSAVNLFVTATATPTTTTGAKVPAGAAQTFDIEPGEILHGITAAASATITVHVTRSRLQVRAA